MMVKVRSESENNPLYAVLTGDVVDSSRIAESSVPMFSDTLKEAFKKIESIAKSPVSPAFERFRGDSFQGIIEKPEDAMKSCLMIRALLRSAQPEGSNVSWDARIAIGIGSITHLAENATTGDGEAYRRSGPVLDALKSEERLAVKTPWPSVDNELEVGCALLDAIIAKWSPRQAETFIMLMDEKNREQMGDQLGVSQAAVHYRVKGSGWFAIEKYLTRYQRLINEHLNN